ncbi:UNVERIFIED_CONTAM: hypothetical protein K2H54_030010, partial [Gekko kuhli]
MKKPICLIENKLNEPLKINQKALQLLQDIQQPVVVVAIVGLYRTGKSYLMNKLAGKNKGFSLGTTIQANTTGIWMWCLPHPQKRDHTLVLLDTEGLGDVEKSNTENDTWIFALSVLLSSTLVYNSMGIIDQGALDKLQYVTELTKCIKVKATPTENSKKDASDDFLRFFPAFIWAVRDFCLGLEHNGHPISTDEYLEIALRRKKDNPEKLDLAKKCIRQYFPSRKCFVFDRPTITREELQNLENLSESKLLPSFVKEVDIFRQYIYKNAEAKVIQGGHVVTGTLLGNLAVSYVDSIRSGTVPCIENAVLALAQIENSAAVQEAIKRYEDRKERLLKLPTETVEELLKVHSRCEKEAIKVFMARSFNDKGQYQKQLRMKLESKLKDLCSRNTQASLDRCQALLTQLFQDLEMKIASGIYAVPGGYQHFLKDQKEQLEKYHRAPGKGLMASRALKDYLKYQEAAAQSILKADRNLTQKEKEAEVERVRAQAAEQEAELQRKLKEEALKMAEEKKK